MFLTRWKMMAGVLGVSLGGLAAMAGQCTKSDPAKGAPPSPEMPTTSAPAVAPVMPPPTVPSLPPIPAADSSKAPAVLPVIPASGMMLPMAPPAGSTVPPVLPVELPAPPAPMVGKPEPMSPKADLPGVPLSGATIPAPVVTPSASSAASPPMSIPADPLIETPPPAPTTITKSVAAAPAPAATAPAHAKYRFLPRVGEGAPIFEVRSGDDLMLKVVCEKVDVKSPEKGHGLSSVRAAGKVRFAGFGAEGTCDELQFLAGTGEVAMTGSVKIQVKDKLGRVESELSADTLRYRIDPHTITGNRLLKP